MDLDLNNDTGMSSVPNTRSSKEKVGSGSGQSAGPLPVLLLPPVRLVVGAHVQEPGALLP